MSLTKKELKKLRSALPNGSYTTISKETALSPVTVRASLFYPDRVNQLVIEKALEIIEKEKVALKTLKSKIREI